MSKIKKIAGAVGSTVSKPFRKKKEWLEGPSGEGVSSKWRVKRIGTKKQRKNAKRATKLARKNTKRKRA